MDRMLEFLSNKILDPNYTIEISAKFPNLLLLIVTKAFPLDKQSIKLHNHQQKCIALGKLLNGSPDILK